MADIRAEILTETGECLEAIAAELLRFKGQQEDRALLKTAARRAHTVASACGFLGLSLPEAVAYACEALLGRCCDGVLLATSEAIQLLLGAIDRIRTLLVQGDAEQTGPDGDDRALIARLEAAALDKPADAPIAAPTSIARDRPQIRRSDNSGVSAGPQTRNTSLSRSEFLAAASHDLRQPLQTLALLQGLLAKRLKDKDALRLVDRADEAVLAMSGMLNALLDINQLEAGAMRPEVQDFPVNELFAALSAEFAGHAKAKGLGWRVAPSWSTIRTDPRLLGQMIRSFLSSAMKHTRKGTLLLGCRRRGGDLHIEVWNSGLRIPTDWLRAVFGDVDPLENPAGESSRGLGLGLAIGRRLGDLLGVTVAVHSHSERGSVFVLQVPLATSNAGRPQARIRIEAAGAPPQPGSILIVEDDPPLRDSLDLFLRAEGHVTASCENRDEAVRLVTLGLRPDLILIDHDLPGAQTGLDVITHLRGMLGRDVPALVLTGDVSTKTLREIAAQGCEQRSKPVTTGDLSRLAKRLLSLTETRRAPLSPRSTDDRTDPVVFLIDGDHDARTALGDLLRASGRLVCDYASAEDFLVSYHSETNGVVLINAAMPGMNGLALLERLKEEGYALPAIMITNNGDVPAAVRAMRAGAADLIEKPVGRSSVLASIDRALEHARNSSQQAISRAQAAARLANLTPRQRLILDLVLAGQPSKIIAADLGISQRTVEAHRAAIMQRTDSRSLAELVRLAMAAA